MLKPAIQYQDQLATLYQAAWFDDRYKYYFTSHHRILKLEDNTWEWHEFVSIDGEGKVLGYIYYRIDRWTNNCYNFGAINFTNNPLFGRDVIQVIRDIFEKFNFNKLHFSVVVGNPVEKTYDRLCQKYGGHILCIEKAETKLMDGKYHDMKRYEIFREDYLTAVRK